MRSRWFFALGLGLLLAWGCQYVAGLEERSELRASSVQGGEGGEGGEAGGGGDGGGMSGGGGGSFPGTGGGGQGGQAGQAGAGGQGPVLARPPPRVGEPMKTGSADPRFFIVRTLDFGFRDGNGKLLSSGFGKKLGFDFDGKCTVSNNKSTRGCKAVENTLFEIYGFNDGEECRDNVFGGAIFPAIGQKSNFDLEINYRVESKGAPTLLFEIEDLDDGPNDAYAPANIYVAAQVYEEAPNWGAPQPRILDHESLDVVDENGNPCPLQFNPANNVATVPDGCKTKAKLRFPNGYVANNTWVSGPFDPENNVVESGSGTLMLGGVKLDAKLQAVLVTLNFFDDTHQAVTSAMYGAVISSSELKAALPEFLDKVCIPQNFLNTDIISLISSTADILQDPPFHGDPEVLCNALTIGLGMTVVPSKLDGDTVTGKFRPYVGKSLPFSPCGEGGQGGASGAGGQGGAGGAGKAGSG